MPKSQKNNTAQHSTAQHSTAQHSTAQHSTAQHSTALLLIVLTLAAVYFIHSRVGFGNLLRSMGFDYYASVNDVPLELRGGFQLVALVGQSNMSGRGDVPPEQDYSRGVWMFGNDYRWKLAEEPVDSGVGQIDMVSFDGDAGYGPSLRFGKLFRSFTQAPVGLIPCAKGGSSLGRWAPSRSRDSLFGSCVHRIREALKVGHLTGILIFQGETNALTGFYSDEAEVLTYQQELADLITAFRRTLRSPNLPIVIAQIAQWPGPPYNRSAWESIQIQQVTFTLDCTAVIPTQDMGGGLHFTNWEYDEIARRFAIALNELIESGCHQ